MSLMGLMSGWVFGLSKREAMRFYDCELIHPLNHSTYPPIKKREALRFYDCELIHF